jgi:hypothetical protein
MSEFVVTVRRRSDVGFEDSSAPAGPAMSSIEFSRLLGPAMQSIPRLPDGPAMSSVPGRLPAGAAMSSVPGRNPVAQRPPLGPAMSSTNGPAMSSTNGT